jgi:PLP dependent protein
MLKENISVIISRIKSAASRAGRNPDEIKLVAVSKTVGVEAIQAAIDAGQTRFGENRVQEARDKILNLKSNILNENIKWHLIGHLQRNKAKYTVGLFELIHSVDSIALADELQRQTEKTASKQSILVEVKLSDEESKHGIAEKELETLLGHIQGLKGLALEGLMTIPPFFGDPEEARPYFRRLRELRDAMQEKGFNLPELSMGMSNDFEVAIEEGATFVRVGTAIFGERG